MEPHARANSDALGAPPQRLGRYEILGRLAAGGMAEVLLGRMRGPLGFERPVAIKRILPHLAENRAFVDMFLDEARIAAGIRHARVAQVHECTDSRSTRRIDSRSARRFALGARRSECADSSAHA